MKEGIFMTKKYRRRILGSVFIVLLSALWIWRYYTINEYYQSLDQSSIPYYSMGEEVYFEDDFITLHESANGYSICVDDFKIVDYAEYINSLPEEIEPDYPSDKLGLVTITLRNHSNAEDAIFLSSFTMHGIDSYQGMDWQLLTASNPVLGEGHGIRLREGMEMQFILPFVLRKEFFGFDTWAHLENYQFYLQVTTFPAEKTICLSIS